MKKLFLISFFIMTLAIPLLASAADLNLEYPFGNMGPNPTPCQYIKTMYIWGLGIVGAVAVAAIAYGGFLYMIGDLAGKNEGKDYIWSALIGILLLFGSYLILNTLNPDLAKCQEPSMPQTTITPVTPVATTTPSGQAPDNAFSFDPGIQAQMADASPTLQSLLNCMSAKVPGNVGVISSISDSKIAAGTCSFAQCPSTRSGCSHTYTCSGSISCHYGGSRCKGKSYAVDFGDEGNASTLSKAARQCESRAFVNFEGNHLHISVGAANNCGCN